MLSILRGGITTPFGMEQPGRSYSSNSYRYGFQGQEKDDEIKGSSGTSINYKYRMHDPRLGRFLSIDPLAPDYPWNSPYAFSENRVIDSRELEGLEKISVNTFSFVPFENFGGGYKGDGANRKFGDPINSQYGQENFKIGGSVDFDLRTTQVSNTQEYGSLSTFLPTGDKQFSEAKLDFSGGYFHKERSSINSYFSVSGNVDAGPMGFISADIDVNVNFRSEPVIGLESTYRISGKVSGDAFPANELFLTDQAGTSIFLGVSGADGGPYFDLPFQGFEFLSSFDFNLTFDSKDNIIGVTQGDSSYSPSAWNERFTSKNPKDGDVKSVNGN